MLQFIRYYGKYQDLRGSFGGLPSWARVFVVLAAVPGAILALLSLLALVVSILALLLLTVPVYRLMVFITGGGGRDAEPEVTVTSSPVEDMIDAEV
ncbi:MAG TPA: hypothetical protein VK968_05530, partial [Roseimicrobium sp.]|nr:hypothetical protein [Roseimicrobium sp.]